jgi:hypothetical protein
MQKALSPAAIAGVVIAIIAVVALIYLLGFRKPAEPTPTFAPPERTRQTPPAAR